jgi:hypothetical protein
MSVGMLLNDKQCHHVKMTAPMETKVNGEEYGIVWCLFRAKGILCRENIAAAQGGSFS